MTDAERAELERLRATVARVRALSARFTEHAAHITGHPWMYADRKREAELVTAVARRLNAALEDD